MNVRTSALPAVKGIRHCAGSPHLQSLLTRYDRPAGFRGVF